MTNRYSIGSKELTDGRRFWIAAERKRETGHTEWIGWIEDDGPIAWCHDGKAVYTLAGDKLQIVKKPREYWLNVYNDGQQGAWPTRALADEHARCDRVECIRVREMRD